MPSRDFHNHHTRYVEDVLIEVDDATARRAARFVAANAHDTADCALR